MTDRDMKRILGAKPKIKLRSRAKLTDAQETELRRRYHKLNEDKAALMAEYGIAESTFYRATLGGKLRVSEAYYDEPACPPYGDI